MNVQILIELQQLQQASPDGTLKRRAVLNAARDPASAMHAHFEWDVTKAAEKYNLIQAGRLIRVAVDFLLPTVEDRGRIYVSMYEDRKLNGGGYRPMVDVLSNDQRAARFLAQAYSELVTFGEKYRVLQALVPKFREALAAMLAVTRPVPPGGDAEAPGPEATV